MSFKSYIWNQTVHRTQYARSTQAALIYEAINELQLQSVTYLSW